MNVPPYPATEKQTEESMLLSMRWAKRSYDAFHNGSDHASENAIFGIVQGGVFEKLRHHSAAALKDIPFDGLRHWRPCRG